MPARAKRGGQKAPAPGPAKKSKGAARTFGGSTVMVCIGGVIENRKCHGPIPIKMLVHPELIDDVGSTYTIDTEDGDRD